MEIFLGLLKTPHLIQLHAVKSDVLLIVAAPLSYIKHFLDRSGIINNNTESLIAVITQIAPGRYGNES